ASGSKGGLLLCIEEKRLLIKLKCKSAEQPIVVNACSGAHCSLAIPKDSMQQAIVKRGRISNAEPRPEIFVIGVVVAGRVVYRTAELVTGDWNSVKSRCSACSSGNAICKDGSCIYSGRRLKTICLVRSAVHLPAKPVGNRQIGAYAPVI